MLGAASSSPPSSLCSFVALMCGFDFFYAKQKLGSSARAMPRGFGLSFNFGRESSKRAVN